MSQSESTISSLAAFAMQSWSTNKGKIRGVNEIINGFRDLGLYTKADELEENLFKMQDKQFSLRKTFNEAKRLAEMAKQRAKECERQLARMQKTRLAFLRYMKTEKKRQEREAAKKRLREQKEKRIAANIKMHEERLKLAIANRISRQYNFSYFSRMTAEARPAEKGHEISFIQ